MNFGERLMREVQRKRTVVMVGIDPRYDSLPDSLRTGRSVGDAYLQFSLEILSAVHDLVPAVKFQSAFFEAAGIDGMKALHAAMTEATRLGLVVILDAKRGDIGSTADAYAEAYLGESPSGERAWPADALTINPFLGQETLDPFVQTAKRQGRGVFVLVRTSNPGSADLQTVEVAGGTISDRIGQWVETWNAADRGALGYGPVGAVVGATYAALLQSFRERMPSTVLLLPGYGAQGASGLDIANAFDARGLGAVVNNSRGIIFAYAREKYARKDWRDAVRSATQEMIADLAAHTPAGNLLG